MLQHVDAKLALRPGFDVIQKIRLGEGSDMRPCPYTPIQYGSMGNRFDSGESALASGAMGTKFVSRCPGQESVRKGLEMYCYQI